MRRPFVLSCLAIPLGALAQTPQTLAAGGGHRHAHRGAGLRRAGLDQPHRQRRDPLTATRWSTSPRISARCPACMARDRQNYAQDVQISVRGFGARSTFGIRGVRLYVDGIPATLPDGQGQITNVELGSVGRIEVLRGPFSALYGNSAGGVIQDFTEEGTSTAARELRGRPPAATASCASGAKVAGVSGRPRLRRQRQAASTPTATASTAPRPQARQCQVHAASRRGQQADPGAQQRGPAGRAGSAGACRARSSMPTRAPSIPPRWPTTRASRSTRRRPAWSTSAA